MLHLSKLKENQIGSTLKGIGPTYMDKTGRNGIRVGDILEDNFKDKYNELVEKHKKILSYTILNITKNLKELGLKVLIN